MLDSRSDIAAAVNHARASMGRAPLPLEAVGRYVGDGLQQLLERAFETREPDAIREATGHFRAHYGVHFLDATRPYPGVLETLERLRGKAMAVVTNKPADFARQMLAAMKIDGCFRAVIGDGDTREKKPHPAPFLRALELSGVPAGRALVVGDGPQDLAGGRAAGIRTCAVTFGFTAREALAELKPDYMIDRMQELVDIVK